jgi:ATP-dependent protease ClpP protease subunit
MENTEIPQIVHATFSGNVNNESLNHIFHSLGSATQQSVKAIHLLFESSGGSVADGVSLFNFFNSFPLELSIYNSGGVASVAVVAFLGAPRVASSRSSPAAAALPR